MKKVLLINPPTHTGAVEAAGMWPPLALLYIAGSLRKNGYEVEIYDAMAKRHDFVMIRKAIEESGADVVASTAYTAMFNDARTCLKIAKEVNANITTVIGGIHATMMYNSFLPENEGIIDFAILGEGEGSFSELLKALDNKTDPSQVMGVAFSKNGKVICGPQRKFIPDLDKLEPAWDLVNWDDYHFLAIPGSRPALIGSSRGCIHTCAFCSQHKFWRQTYRQRSASSLLFEIKYLFYKHGVNVFLFADEYATKDRSRWEEILDGLIEMNLPIYLIMETRVEDILRDEEILPKYRKAGFIHIFIGVESASQDTLDRFNKGIKIEQSKRAIELLNSANIVSECSFIIGLPEESRESIQQTLDLAIEYNPDIAHFLFFTPWPYGDMYEEMKPYIRTDDYSLYSFVEVILKPKNLSRDELFEAALQCYKIFYSPRLVRYVSIEDDFKRYYLLRAMKAMIEHGFIKDYVLTDVKDTLDEILQKANDDSGKGLSTGKAGAVLP